MFDRPHKMNSGLENKIKILRGKNMTGLEFRNELVRRLNENANRYVGGICNGHEYPEAELFEIDEVYEIINRVLDGIPEDTGE